MHQTSVLGPKHLNGVRRFQRQQKTSGFPESSLAECRIMVVDIIDIIFVPETMNYN